MMKIQDSIYKWEGYHILVLPILIVIGMIILHCISYAEPEPIIKKKLALQNLKDSEILISDYFFSKQIGSKKRSNLLRELIRARKAYRARLWGRAIGQAIRVLSYLFFALSPAIYLLLWKRRLKIRK